MRWPRILVLLYGLFNLFLGVQSYFFPSGKPSLISLIVAGGIGVLVLVCYGLIPTKPRIGYIGTMVLALVVAGNFAKKALADQILYPAAVAFWVSLAVIAALTAAHFMAMSKREPNSEA